MRRLWIAALLVSAACASGGSKSDDGDAISDRVGDWDASLSAVGNSGVTATVGAQSVGVGTGVRISLRGATPNEHHPWHVHRGQCGDNGPIVGSANDYPALHVGTDGTASANATIGVALVEETPYYVNVHRSPTDLGTIIACGRLTND
jgi:hypothetical protein